MALDPTILETMRQRIDAGEPFCITSQVIEHKRWITLSVGQIEKHHYLSDIPTKALPSVHCNEALASISMIPYCQMKERRLKVADGGEPIITLVPHQTVRCTMQEFERVFDHQTALTLEGELRYNLDDQAFKKMVADVIDQEIRNGEGSNFLVSRKAFGMLNQSGITPAITLLKRLIHNEFGSYLTFCFYDGSNTFVGASPERHLTIRQQVATMNPICGTLPKHGVTNLAESLTDFVQDKKEINELFMVVDETLKMMIPICPDGGKVYGPFLKEMSQVIHTENVLEGETKADRIDAFRCTMYAPTMVGSPIESAARVIYKHEKRESRGYYTSALLILGDDTDHMPYLDSAITIRTLHLRNDGSFTLASGASIVRDSDPAKETVEIQSKALGMLKAITSDQPAEPQLPQVLTPGIEALMMARNTQLSPFWVQQQERESHKPLFKGKSIFIINNEDDFVYMMAHIFRSVGATVHLEHIRDIGSASNIPPSDLVILGPGPGDPNDLDHPKIRKLSHILEDLMNVDQQKIFGVCLGHQMLCRQLGIEVRKLPEPTQGVQLTVPHFGTNVSLGFYNTFAGCCDPTQPRDFQVSCDDSGFVYAIRGNTFGSIQAHAESIISRDGPKVLYSEVGRLLEIESAVIIG